MSELNIRLNPMQMKFVNCNESRSVYSGGVGSGKTFAGALWSVLMTQTYPDCVGIITASSIKQLNRATLPEFFKILDMMHIPYQHKVNAAEVIVNNRTRVILFSAENYDDIRGPNAGWAWADECAFYNEQAYHNTCARLRDQRGPCQWKGTTTTNGFNWLYRTFVENPISSSAIFKASTKDNMANLGGK